MSDIGRNEVQLVSDVPLSRAEYFAIQAGGKRVNSGEQSRVFFIVTTGHYYREFADSAQDLLGPATGFSRNALEQELLYQSLDRRGSLFDLNEVARKACLRDLPETLTHFSGPTCQLLVRLYNEFLKIWDDHEQLYDRSILTINVARIVGDDTYIEVLTHRVVPNTFTL